MPRVFPFVSHMEFDTWAQWLT